MTTAIRAITRLQDADDAPALGAGQNGYALTWDNASGAFAATTLLTGGLLATGATTGATSQAQAFTKGISIPGATTQYPLTISTFDGSFLGVLDPTFEMGFNIQNGDIRTVGVPAVWLAMEGNYANDTYQASQVNYCEFYIGQSDELGNAIRPFAMTWDNEDIRNYCQGHIYIAAASGFNFVDKDGGALITFGGEGGMQLQTRFQFAGANPYIQVIDNYPLGLIANSKFVFVSNTYDGLEFGSDRDTNLYRSDAATLKTDHALIVTGDVELDGALNHDGASVGFYGTAPIAQAVLATGAGATVDNVIAALQNLGLVKQS